jgi:hypothetical protein
MPKQFDQQRNGQRTDLPDDVKRLLMQAFIVTGEESSQHRQRPPRPLDQGVPRQLRGPSSRWPAGDLPSFVPGRGFWKESTRPGGAVIGTARPPG